MLKKILCTTASALSIIIMIILIDSNMIQSINAANQGGAVYGRLNKIVHGDSFSTNIQDGALSWQAIKALNNSANYSPSDWFMMSVDPLAQNIAPYNADYNVYYSPYSDTNIKPYITTIRNDLTKVSRKRDSDIIVPRVIQTLPYGIPEQQDPDETNVFSVNYWEWSNILHKGTVNDRFADFSEMATSYPFWLGNADNYYIYAYIDVQGNMKGIDYRTPACHVRASAIIDTSDFLFAVSDPVSTTLKSMYSILEPEVTNNKASSTPMKMRFKNSSFTVNNTSVSTPKKLIANDVLNLSYAGANTGSDIQVSLLITKDNEFAYYIPIEKNTTSGTYQLDTSGFTNGKYSAYFITEESTSTGSPVYCSDLSNATTFEVIPSPKNIKLNKTPQSPNTSTYEYKKNVSASQKIGELTFDNDSFNNTYSLAADSSGSLDYTKFVFPQNNDGSYVVNAAGFPTLAVGTSELEAGTYTFKVKIQPNVLPASEAVISDDITITVNKTNQDSLDFYTDSTNTTKLTSLIKDKMDPDFKIYAHGGASSIDDNQITYVVKSDPNHILKSVIGSGSHGDVALTQKIGSAIITATKKGNSNYQNISADLTITTQENSDIPQITAIKAENSQMYTSGIQYNKDVILTLSYPAGYRGSLPLKLKERDRGNYQTPWNTIAAKSVSDGDQITLSLGSEEWIYKEYELYFEGYEKNAVSFIVDISNVAPVIPDIVDGQTYHDKKQVNLDLYPSRVPTSNPYTATLNGNPYTSMSDIINGTHQLIVSDAYGNKTTVNFTIDLPGPQGTFKQTQTLIYDDASTDKTVNNKVAGKVIITSGNAPYTYAPKDAATSSKFRIDANGNVYIVNGISLSAGTYPVVFTVKDSNNVESDISGNIIVDKGKQSEFNFVDSLMQPLPHLGGMYDAYSEVYGKNKKFLLNVSGNKGNVTFDLKDKSITENGVLIDLSDVIEVDKATGEVTIKNASLAAQLGKVIVVATSAATSNYEKESIELPINIQKASQASFAFKYPDKTVQAGSGSFKPDFINGPPDGSVILTSTDALVSVTGTNHDTFTYNVSDKKDITLKAQKSGNRNYEDSPVVSMILHVLEKGQTLFDVDVKAQDTSTNKVYYGDSSAQFIPVKPDTGASYSYRSLDTTIADMNGTDTFIPKKAGTVTFEITKKVTGENDVVITKNIIIYPKPITITIDDKQMLKGEMVPAFTFTVPANDLVGLDTITNIVMSCKDGSSLVDSTSAKGTYTIKGSYTKSDYPNYDIKFKDGTLTIHQDMPLPAWYTLVGTLGDNGWYVSDVNVEISQDALDNGYTQISGDQSVWGTSFAIQKEDINDFTAYFKKDSNAVSEGVNGQIKIDKKAPIVKKIQAKNSNNALEDLINKVTFDAFFKKGTQITIEGDDGNGSAKVSGVKEASYSIQKLDANNNPDGSPKLGIATADSSGLMNVTMNEVGTYKVCALLKDNAGNEMDREQCVQVSIKDPQKDFDSNNDGCPDLNVTMGTGSPVLNIDKNLDGVPELNIDSDGDGKADINVDTDNDGRPDVNLVILNDWKPNVCTTKLEYNYGYQLNIEAKINIAKDNKKAELNIDWDGDMKADFNIDINRDGKADVNIGKIHTWEPEQDYQYDGFDYDTIKKNSIVPTLNIDTDGDGLPDVNLDMNGDGIPELNIDNTGDMVPDIDIDSDGDGIKDINLDENSDGKADKNIVTITEWKPEKNCDKDDFKYDTMGDLKPDSESETPLDPDKKDTLIHDGTQIVVTIKGNKHFKSSMKLVVDDITDIIGNEDYGKIMKDTSSNQEVKKVYNARLIEDNIVVQPDGTIEVKIPITSELKNISNLSILIEKKDGTYEKVNFKEVGGYYVFSTDYLGKISMVGDKDKKLADNDSATSVKGAYKNNVYGSGGVNTGDENIISNLFILIIITMSILISYYKKGYRKD